MAIYNESNDWNMINFAKSIPIDILNCRILQFTVPVSQVNDSPQIKNQFMTVR